MTGNLSPDALPAVYLAGPAERERVPDHLRLDDRVPTWDTATRKLVKLAEYFENENISHQAVSYDIFTESWANAAWQRLYQIDYRACEWATQTAFLVFTGSYYLDPTDETHMPPITFFARLQASADARQKALSRGLSNVDRWQSVRVIGSGPNGYPVLFLGLYLSNTIQRDSLTPVVTAHINNSPVASGDAHHPENVITLEGGDDSAYPSASSRLIHALGQRVPGLGSGKGVTAESDQTQATAAVIRGGQWRAYRFGESS